MQIWLLSPYHSGSHRAWALGYQRHSRHTVRLLTLPGRFWKWRMQGGAMALATQARRLLAQSPALGPDVILATDMVNLPAWLGLLRRELPAAPPIALYMHENQLTYPWRPGEKPDNTYAMINWLSQLSADLVLFNSRYHRESWFEALPRLLKHFPDHNHLDLVDTVAARADCLPVGIDCAPAPPLDSPAHVGATPSARESQGAVQPPAHAPLILWNQRWEYDKQPGHFFDLLYRLQANGVAFRVAVAGENFRNVPEEFEDARARLGAAVVHWGYVAARDDYRVLLAAADLVVSTAAHEFFGISILEAIAAGAFPLLPNRLSYPELIPPALHPACLYADEDDLYAKTVQRLSQPRDAPPSLQDHVRAHFDWPAVADAYDHRLERLARSTG